MTDVLLAAEVGVGKDLPSIKSFTMFALRGLDFLVRNASWNGLSVWCSLKILGLFKRTKNLKTFYWIGFAEF